ncbi:unnamed protein product, partial [Symbiodinium sp. CCMP2456]
VRRLALEVRSLQLLVETRLGARDAEAAYPPAEEPVPHSSVPVTPERGSTLPIASVSSPALLPSPPSAVNPGGPSLTEWRGQLNDTERRALARRIGVWVRRSLDENHRGPSGREENPQASRVYLVARDCRGTAHDPPLLFRTFSAARAWVKPAGYVPEQTVFVGLPTLWEAAIVAEAAGLRPQELHYVVAGGVLNYDFEIGALAVGDGDSRRTISVILVAPFEERLLAIFPHKAWDKKANKRKLPAGPFTKPLLCEVACASLLDRTVVSAEAPVKVWFGMLARALAEQIVFDSSEPPDIPFGPPSSPVLPYAPALVELAENQFGFQSALSSPGPRADPFEARLQALESTLGQLNASVQQLVGRDGAPPDPRASRAKAAPKARAAVPGAAKAGTRAGVGSIPGTPAPPGKAKEVPGLDPAVVKAALDSGVSAFELKELGGLLAKGRGALGDFPAAPAEAALDVAEGASLGEPLSSSSSGRSKGAAYRLLKDSLDKAPELIYQEIEKLLDEDLLSRRAIGSLSSAQSSARAWVEFRSRVGYYPTTIRTMWCLAGILDALRDDKVSEARARTCLALAALDQACIDAGSWAYAQEILLESPPPLGSFQGRKTLSDPLESYHTRLLSGRWSDLLLHRVKELESFLDAKRKLGRGRGGDSGGRGTGEDTPPEPGGKNRGRGGKGALGAPAAPEKPELLADGTVSFCHPTGCAPPPFVDGAFFSSSLTSCDAAAAAVASCDPAAVLLTARLLDNFLRLPLHRVSQGPACTPFSLRGCRLSSACLSRSWGRIADRLNAWTNHPPVGLEDMGRAAGKVEKIEEQLEMLKTASERATAAMPNLAPAKDVEAGRLNFPVPPRFDPCPFLDDRLRALYVDPASSAIPFAELPFDPPKVRFRARDKQSRLELLALLDASDRLVLFPADGVSLQGCCGLFAVPKTLDRDRLIVDARPGNMVQVADNRWLALMPTSAALLCFELRDDEALWASGTDLRDFYHNFLITSGRAMFYRFAGTFAPKDLTALKCFRPEFLKCRQLSAALATMAMGDLNSVSFGQCSHLGLLLAHEVASFEELMTLRGRPTRGDLSLGVVIDDLVVLEKALLQSGPARTDAVMDRAFAAYAAAPLPVHEGKTFLKQHKASFWGSDVDGLQGIVRPAWHRLIPLVGLTIACIRLPVLTVSLLEVLAGSWVSVLSYRRRCLSLLNWVYFLQRGRSRASVVRVPPELRSELLRLCLVAPFLVCDMRAQSSELLVATDSSDDCGAGATARVGPAWGKELQRHVLAKGLWNRLLRPSEAMQRRAGCLDQEDELPGDTYRTHALWTLLCRSLPFKLFAAFPRKAGLHINIKEAESYLIVEERLSAGPWESSRCIGLLDSQVVLGALLKGRSSSSALNRCLQASLPGYLFFNIHPSFSFVASEDNPSDDPSRYKEVRKPNLPLPRWFQAGMSGDFAPFDLFLSDLDLLPEQMQGLPQLLCDFRSRCGVPLPYQGPRRVTSEAPESDDHYDAPASQDYISARSVGEREAPAPSAPCFQPSFPKAASAFFSRCSAGQFLWPGGRRPPSSRRPAEPVYLCLFAGSRTVARAWAGQSSSPALTFDWKDGPSQDLSDKALQDSILDMLRLGAFSAVGVASENRLIDFTCSVASACLDLGIPFWIDGPDTSLLWSYPPLRRLLLCSPALDFWSFDRCRFSEPWQKRTRVLTTSDLAGRHDHCRGGHRHLHLRGRLGPGQGDGTKAADSFPKRAAEVLVRSLLHKVATRDGGPAEAAFTGTLRVGEAKVPGPRQKPRVPRTGSLFDVELIEQATLRVREQIWKVFLAWLRENVTELAVLALFRCPPLLALVMRDYGDVLYQTGFPLGSYRQLLAHAQKIFPLLRPHMSVAWNMVSRWEELQPVSHRTPVPEALLRALIGLSHALGWERWTAATLAIFFFVSRPGEVLRATRGKLLTPEDALEPFHRWLYLRLPPQRAAGGQLGCNT